MFEMKKPYETNKALLWEMVFFGLHAWGNAGILKDNFRNLYTLSVKQSAFVAEICDISTDMQCWNLGFVRNFNDWKIQEVNRLNNILENLKMRTNVNDSTQWKPTKNVLFSVRSC